MHRSRFYLMALGILLMVGLLFGSSNQASIVLADVATVAPPGEPTDTTSDPEPGGGGGGGTGPGCGMIQLGNCTCNQLDTMLTTRVIKRIKLMNVWDNLQCDPIPPEGFEGICNSIDQNLNQVEGEMTAILTEARNRPCAWAH